MWIGRAAVVWDGRIMISTVVLVCVVGRWVEGLCVVRVRVCGREGVVYVRGLGEYFDCGLVLP